MTPPSWDFWEAECPLGWSVGRAYRKWLLLLLNIMNDEKQDNITIHFHSLKSIYIRQAKEFLGLNI